MEHGPDDRKHYGESKLHYNLFRHRNKFKWLFEDCIRNSFSGRISYSHRFSFTNNAMCRGLFNTHRQWCNLLSMEYRSNHSKYHSKPEFNHDLFRYGNKLQRMFRHSISNGFC